MEKHRPVFSPSQKSPAYPSPWRRAPPGDKTTTLCQTRSRKSRLEAGAPSVRAPWLGKNSTSSIWRRAPPGDKTTTLCQTRSRKSRLEAGAPSVRAPWLGKNSTFSMNRSLEKSRLERERSRSLFSALALFLPPIPCARKTPVFRLPHQASFHWIIFDVLHCLPQVFVIAHKAIVIFSLPKHTRSAQNPICLRSGE